MICRKIWTAITIGITALTCLTAAPGKTATLESNQVEVEYASPKSSAQDALHKLVREQRVLEEIRDLLEPFRLPKRLLIRAEGCDGQVNAWYDDGIITVCYEYLDWAWQSAHPEQTTPTGIAPVDALTGPVIQIILHEAGHAVFDLLKVPIFGREEDAADQFSVYLMLQAGKDEARRLINGAAYQYRSGVQSENQNIATKRFAQVHGTMAQRFFNILCLAYGADDELFKDIVANGQLPKERAEDCSSEYDQVAYAFKTLIEPFIDPKLAEKFYKSWLPPIHSPVPRRPAGSEIKAPQ
jgi:hypothetical protein